MRNDLADVEACCRGVIEDGADIFQWEWDDYIGSMLTVISSASVPEASRILDSWFFSRWDPSTLSSAPDRVQTIADALGGLRPKQHLLVSEVDPHVMVYAAWWPWGDGDTVSIRIGLVTTNIPPYDSRALWQEFLSWFEAGGDDDPLLI